MSLFEKALQELEKHTIMPERVPDLTRMIEAVKDTGFYEWPFWKNSEHPEANVIVVAGTNGKGGTCAVLESLLSAAGQRTGFYSSPHLVSYTERMRVAGEEISEELFGEAYFAVEKPAIQHKLSHFEILTLMALWVFCSGEKIPPVDKLILEVGLGGTWDATNAVPHTTAIIARLGLDHTQLLGETINDVARNKLGIVPENGVVIHMPFPKGSDEAVSETKTKSKTNCRWVSPPGYSYTSHQGMPPKFMLQSPWGDVELALAGGRGAENTMLALTAFREMGYAPEIHLRAVSRVNWPGRMELVAWMPNGIPVYASGDHNVQGIESLIELLPHYERKTLRVVVGIGKEKNAGEMLARLFEQRGTRVYLTETPFRGLALNEYGEWLELAAGAAPDFRQMLALALNEAVPGDMVLVTGSLYLIGALKAELKTQRLPM